jgi:hypothetical protein
MQSIPGGYSSVNSAHRERKPDYTSLYVCIFISALLALIGYLVMHPFGKAETVVGGPKSLIDAKSTVAASASAAGAKGAASPALVSDPLAPSLSKPIPLAETEIIVFFSTMPAWSTMSVERKKDYMLTFLSWRLQDRSRVKVVVFTPGEHPETLVHLGVIFHAHYKNWHGYPIVKALLPRVERLYPNVRTFIMLDSDIYFSRNTVMPTIKSVRSQFHDFLIIGRRLNSDQRPIVRMKPKPHFDESHMQGKLPVDYWNFFVDYFIYSRGFFNFTADTMPPYVFGGVNFDTWLVWNAVNTVKLPVIDGSHTLKAFHLNHPDNKHPKGLTGASYNSNITHSVSSWKMVYEGGIHTSHFITEPNVKGVVIRPRLKNERNSDFV